MAGAKTKSILHRASRGRGVPPHSSIPADESRRVVDGVSPRLLALLGPLAPLLLSDDPRPDDLRRRLRRYASALLATSAFFWAWALHNTLQLRRSSGGFDLGVFSLFGTGVSSALLLRASGGREGEAARDVDAARKERGHAPPSKRLRTFAVLTHLLVVANYLLGLVFAFTASKSGRVYVYFATYCFVFALLWTAVAFSSWVLVSAYRGAVGRAYGADAVDPPGTCLGLLLGAWMALANRSTGHADEAIDYGSDYGGGGDEDIDDELISLFEGHGDYTSA